ncbi:PIN domain-containing protein [Patescibacteria group bacterium AH-259-L05]|nr:PIN domain-containing protein [Patescibacteria group bacterium AH-259-L05]
MKEYKYFLDSNIFLRAIVKDDLKKARECHELFKKIKKGEIRACTSCLILAEIVWMSKFYKLSKQEIVIILKGILNIKNLKIIDSYNPVMAIKTYETYNVKFIDSLIASTLPIYKENMIVVSYDKDFDKLKIRRIEPSKIIH